MAARVTASGRSSFDDEARAVIAEARASILEVLSLWPANRHDRLVLWVSYATGVIEVGARLRDHDFDAAGIAPQLRRVKNDVPIVLDLRDGRTIVVPWSSVQAT